MNNKLIISLLVKRTVSFFLAICILTFFLYGIGIVQGFMDTTQSNLLRLSVIFGLFLGVGALYGVILDCVLLVHRASVRETRRYVGGMGAYIVVGLLGFAMAAAAAFILVVVEGNG